MIKSRVLGYRINSRRGIWSEQEYRLDHYSKVSQFFRLVELFDNQNQSIKILRDVRGVRAVVTSRLSTWWKDSSSKTTCKQNWVRCEHEDPRVWPQITRENYLRSVTRSTFQTVLDEKALPSEGHCHYRQIRGGKLGVLVLRKIPDRHDIRTQSGVRLRPWTTG